jgi:hypothetical protein
VFDNPGHTLSGVPAHPFDPEIAFRLICWFPPGANTVVVALFGADKASIGDVFYNSVGARADTAIRQWLQQTEKPTEKEDGHG